MSSNTSVDRATLKVTLNLQRKAAIARGGAFDHAGRVRVERMANFDMSRTIFGGLKGIARRFMTEKLAKELVWNPAAAAEIEAVYAENQAAQPEPLIDQRLIDFMINECN
ncbi:MAG: hypothetical protein WA888_09425, partial [Burkholderiaceae bacterium]